jgi:hypothetical protein
LSWSETGECKIFVLDLVVKAEIRSRLFKPILKQPNPDKKATQIVAEPTRITPAQVHESTLEGFIVLQMV